MAPAILGVVCLLGLLALVAPAVRDPAARRPALLAGGGLLLVAATTAADVGGRRDGDGVSVLSGAASLLLSAGLATVQLQLLRARLVTSAARSWLDLANGVPAGLALVWAFAVPPLAAHLATGEGTATVLLTPVGLAWLVFCFCATATLLLSPRDPRMVVLTATSLVLLGGEASSVLLGAGVLDGSGTGTLLRAVAAVGLVLAGLVHDPAADVRAVESASDIAIAPVALTLESIALLSWHLVSPLPAAAAWAALVSVVLTTAKTVVVFRQLDALNSLRAQATTDALTGLGNRRALQEALHGVEAGAAVALVVIDLDRFKAVNDSLGHAAGDELLVELARRLRDGAGDGEVVVRLGGDEFALVAPSADLDAALRRAATAVASLSRPVRVGRSTVSVGASAGVAVAPLHARSAVCLQELADEAMYRAKGRDGAVVVAGGDALRTPERRVRDRRSGDAAD